MEIRLRNIKFDNVNKFIENRPEYNFYFEKQDELYLIGENMTDEIWSNAPKPENIDDALRAFEQAQIKAKEEAALNSRFIKLKDKEQKSFTLTGIIYREWKEFETGKGQKEMMNFELTEKNPKGESKIFSCSIKSGVCGDLLKAIKERKLNITLKRSGEGGKTTYLVVAGA
jgi:hypothetical protein